MTSAANGSQRQPALQDVLNDFGRKPGVMPIHVRNLALVIEHIPAVLP